MLKTVTLMMALLACVQAWGQANTGVQAEVSWADGEVSLEEIYVELVAFGSEEISYGTMQDEIAYVGEDDTRKYIHPQDIQRIEFDYGDFHHVLISSYYNGYYMMPAEVDGKLRVLLYYPSIGDGESTIFETNELNVRVLSIEGGNQGNNARVFRLGFRKAMLDLFHDYPEMQKKIRIREFTYDNWEEMVEYFNATYGDEQE